MTRYLRFGRQRTHIVPCVESQPSLGAGRSDSLTAGTDLYPVASLAWAQGNDINDPSWTVDDDNRSGLDSIQVLGTTTLDFTAVQSHQGKVYLAQTRLSGDHSATAANSINEVLLYNCELQGNLTQQGGDVLWYSSVIFGNITIHDQTSAVNPIPNLQVDTRFFGSGGGSVLPLDGSSSLPDFTVINDIPSPQTHAIAVNSCRVCC